MEKIIAVDYKGKWFILQDSLEGVMDEEARHIDVSWVLNDGLKEHVENCLYYGIPAYLGSDKKLLDKIHTLESEFLN